MKIRTRILATLTAVFASLFVASPALAEEPHLGHSQYSVAGSPVDYVAISIVMVVLIVVVVGTSELVGNLFEKNKK